MKRFSKIILVWGLAILSFNPNVHCMEPIDTVAKIENEDDDDDYKVVKQSPIELKSMEQNTGQIRSYGTAESPNEQLAFNAARAQAIAALQEKVEVYVRYGLIQFMDQTQVNEATSFDAKTTNDIVTAAKGILNGAVVIDSRKLYNGKKKMYKYEVCLAYDKAGILSAMEAQNERILNNREKFEKNMQFAWDELDANNGKLPLREEQANRQNEREQQNLDRQNERDIKRLRAEKENISYYLWFNNQQQGPFSYAQLGEIFGNRTVTQNTKIWFKGIGSWTEISNIDFIYELYKSKSNDDVPPPMN